MKIEQPDPLSQLLTKLELGAEVYVSGDFRGDWAVDTSGSRRIPFHLISAGDAWLHLDGVPPRKLSEGDLVVFPHDAEHVIAHSEKKPEPRRVNAEVSSEGDHPTSLICGFFEFQDRQARPMLDALAPAIVVNANTDSDSFTAFPAISKPANMVSTLISAIVYELTEPQPGYTASIDQLAYLLFVQVLRQQIVSGELKTGLLAALFDKKIGLALSAIHGFPEKKWTLERLANECALGRSAFSERFRHLVGMSAMHYVTQWRMREASLLLKQTQLPLVQIAERVGYDSESSFSKAFKKTLGLPPSLVRKS